MKCVQDNSFASIFNDSCLMSNTEIYENIMNKVKIQYIEISDFEVPENTNEKDACVSYIISIKANSIEYTIQKRFKEFYELHKQVKKRGVDFTKFPKKTIIKTFNLEKIEKRKKLLDEFLNHLLHFLYNKRIYELFNFIKIQDYVQINKKHNYNNDSHSFEYNSEEIKIFEYLEKLDNDHEPNNIKLYNKIEKVLIKDKAKLSMNTIIVIITGTSSQNGLLKLITRTTQFDNSHIVCTKGFSLMMTLLDISLNRYANDFMDVFKRLRVKDLNTLDFESHIEHGKMNGCKEKSFELLNLYMK